MVLMFYLSLYFFTVWPLLLFTLHYQGLLRLDKVYPHKLASFLLKLLLLFSLGFFVTAFLTKGYDLVTLGFWMMLYSLLCYVAGVILSIIIEFFLETNFVIKILMFFVYFLPVFIFQQL